MVKYVVKVWPLARPHCLSGFIKIRPACPRTSRSNLYFNLKCNILRPPHHMINTAADFQVPSMLILVIYDSLYHRFSIPPFFASPDSGGIGGGGGGVEGVVDCIIFSQICYEY